MTTYVDNPFSIGRFEISGEQAETAAKIFEELITKANENMADPINCTMEHIVWDECDRAILKITHEYGVTVKNVY
jgi:hypothetical protein